MAVVEEVRKGPGGLEAWRGGGLQEETPADTDKRQQANPPSPHPSKPSRPHASLWDVRCLHCGSLQVEHRRDGSGQEKNYCRSCGQWSEWVPTLEEIRCEARKLRRHTPKKPCGKLSEELVRIIRELAAAGESSYEIARRLRLSETAVHYVRQNRTGKYQDRIRRCPGCDRPLVGECIVCRNRRVLVPPPRRRPLLEHWKPLRPFWCMAVLPSRLAGHLEEASYYHMDVAASLAEVAEEMPPQIGPDGRRIIIHAARELLDYLGHEQP